MGNQHFLDLYLKTSNSSALSQSFAILSSFTGQPFNGQAVLQPFCTSIFNQRFAETDTEHLTGWIPAQFLWRCLVYPITVHNYIYFGWTWLCLQLGLGLQSITAQCPVFGHHAANATTKIINASIPDLITDHRL